MIADDSDTFGHNFGILRKYLAADLPLPDPMRADYAAVTLRDQHWPGFAIVAIIRRLARLQIIQIIATVG
jgi:hypothetical protein